MMKIIAIAYIAVAIFTFGWSFNALWPDDQRNVGLARADTLLSATACAILLPLYWSVELTRGYAKTSVHHG